MKTTRNLWPLGIILTFVLFFCGMATVVAIAVTHRENLVSENYYESELKFQDQIDAAARANKSGAAVNCDSAGRRVNITLPTAQLAQKFSGIVEFYRPSAPKLDCTFRLDPRADGRQTLDVSGFATGLWLVRARWNAAGQDYFLEHKINVGGK